MKWNWRLRKRAKYSLGNLDFMNKIEGNDLMLLSLPAQFVMKLLFYYGY